MPFGTPVGPAAQEAPEAEREGVDDGEHPEVGGAPQERAAGTVAALQGCPQSEQCEHSQQGVAAAACRNCARGVLSAWKTRSRAAGQGRLPERTSCGKRVEQRHSRAQACCGL